MDHITTTTDISIIETSTATTQERNITETITTTTTFDNNITETAIHILCNEQHIQIVRTIIMATTIAEIIISKITITTEEHQITETKTATTECMS